jgi:hypothetical protein
MGITSLYRSNEPIPAVSDAESLDTNLLPAIRYINRNRKCGSRRVLWGATVAAVGREVDNRERGGEEETKINKS